MEFLANLSLSLESYSALTMTIYRISGMVCMVVWTGVGIKFLRGD